MTSFQVRLADEVYKIAKDIAEARNISLADVIREALEVYTIGVAYAARGKRLVWEDPKNGEKTEILIPGFNVEALSLVGRRSARSGFLGVTTG